MSRILLPLFAGLLAGPAVAADWPALRGSDARQGFYPEFPRASSGSSGVMNSTRN